MALLKVIRGKRLRELRRACALRLKVLREIGVGHRHLELRQVCEELETLGRSVVLVPVTAPMARALLHAADNSLLDPYFSKEE